MQIVLIRSYRFARGFDDDDLRETDMRIPVLSAEEARQGIVSGRVVTVLAASLALAVTAGALLATLYSIPD
jgi:hypothetical protein